MAGLSFPEREHAVRLDTARDCESADMVLRKLILVRLSELPCTAVHLGLVFFHLPDQHAFSMATGHPTAAES